MAAFAVFSDLAARWRPLSSDEQAQATVLLSDASVIVRAECPGIDAKITAQTVAPDTAKLVVCGMVKRAMIASEISDGVTQQAESAGPFTQSLTFANPMGNIYMTKQDKRLLGYGGQRAFTIDTAPVGSGSAWAN